MPEALEDSPKTPIGTPAQLVLVACPCGPPPLA